MEHLYHLVTSFLNQNGHQKIPFLLGFSGGPDSLALFNLLLKSRQEFGYTFAVAHIDHGWRDESKQEAEAVMRMARENSVTSHIMTLSPLDMKGNLESACRDARYSFFSFLCREHNYKAVMLGHHADDQAETVLKRLFEGASLDRLSGMQPVAHYEGMQVWRPFLHVRKKEILDWLFGHDLKGFHDTSNDDSRYLRVRMRQELIPQLSKQFGKEVGPALCRLGEEAAELDEYLNIKVDPFLSKAQCGEMGVWLEGDRLDDLMLLEKKHLVKRFAAIGGMRLSREALVDSVSLLASRAVNKCIEAGSGKKATTLHFDNGRLFLPKGLIKDHEKSVHLLLNGGIYHEDSWKITVNDCFEWPPAGKASDWKELWRSGGEIVLPKRKYSISPPVLNSRFANGETLAKRYSAYKVPVFLRSAVPVIMEDGFIVHEFLTGKSVLAETGVPDAWIKLSLKWSSPDH